GAVAVRRRLDTPVVVGVEGAGDALRQRAGSGGIGQPERAARVFAQQQHVAAGASDQRVPIGQHRAGLQRDGAHGTGGAAVRGEEPAIVAGATVPARLPLLAHSVLLGGQDVPSESAGALRYQRPSRVVTHGSSPSSEAGASCNFTVPRPVPSVIHIASGSPPRRPMKATRSPNGAKGCVSTTSGQPPWQPVIGLALRQLPFVVHSRRCVPSSKAGKRRSRGPSLASWPPSTAGRSSNGSSPKGRRRPK